jgi:hypothetical protein
MMATSCAIERAKIRNVWYLSSLTETLDFKSTTSHLVRLAAVSGKTKPNFGASQLNCHDL